VHTTGIELISLALAAAQQLRASELAVRAISELAAQQQLVDSHFITQALSACDGNHAAEVGSSSFNLLMLYAHIKRSCFLLSYNQLRNAATLKLLFLCVHSSGVSSFTA
jgi:hypothetical protein